MYELHVFCYASEAAFGAVAYLRSKSAMCVTTSCIMVKSRSAPLRPLTILKLELQGAVLGYHMGKTNVNELKMREHPIWWKDSQTVLQ